MGTAFPHQDNDDPVQGHLIDECMEVLEYYRAIGVDFGLAPDNIISAIWRSDSYKKRGRFPDQ